MQGLLSLRESQPLCVYATAAVGIAATAFSVGNSTGQIAALSLAGIVVAAAAFWLIVSRAPSHRKIDHHRE